MRVCALIALFLLGGTSRGAAQISAEFPIEFSSLDEACAVKGFFTGRVAVYSDSIVIVFDSVYIEQASREPPLSLYHLDSLSVALASPADDGGWQPWAQSVALPVPDSLAERSTLSLKGQRFAVAHRENPRLEVSWFVVTFYQILAPRIVPREEQATGTCYAHSPTLVWLLEHGLEHGDEGLLLETVWETTDRRYTNRAEFSPKGLSFAIVARDGSVVIHDLGADAEAVLHDESETITAIAYASDGASLLAGTKTGNLGVWDLETREVTWIGRRPFEIDRAAWLGDTGSALIQSKLGAQRRDPDTGELYDVEGELINTKTGETIWGFTAWQHLDFQNMAASPDGRWVAVHKILGEREVYALDGTDGSVSGAMTKDGSGLSVSVAPNGDLIAVGTPGISLWTVASATMVRHLEGHTNWVVSLDFSPDGKRLISGAGDSTARLWDVETGVELGRIRFPGESTYVGSVSFSSDGKYVLAAAQGGRIVVARTPAR